MNGQNPVESNSPLLFRRYTLPIGPPHAATHPIIYGPGDLSPVELFMGQSGTEYRDKSSPSQFHLPAEGNYDGASGEDAEFCPYCAAMEQPGRTLVDSRELASRR
jgi:hypothetical protein